MNLVHYLKRRDFFKKNIYNKQHNTVCDIDISNFNQCQFSTNKKPKKKKSYHNHAKLDDMKNTLNLFLR